MSQFRAISTVIFLTLALLASCTTPTDHASGPVAENWAWETVSTINEPIARHEAAFVEHDGLLYLIGGRRINPVNVYDPVSNQWDTKSPTPIELHHFQAVSIDDTIYLIGAMTGQWPRETPVERVIAYHPKTDTFEYLHEIPEARRRGGAGAIAHDGKIYIAGGITNGHIDGTRAWLDVYDPKTGEWRVLSDAPNARDHFQLAVADNQLFAFAGRRTRYRTGQSLELTSLHGNVFDLETEQWRPVTRASAIPTQRAGNMAIAWGGEIIVGGGESSTQVLAHSEVEAYDIRTGAWRDWPTLERGRHGSGFAIVGEYLYTASGSGNRGGEPELVSLERLKLPKTPNDPTDINADKTTVAKQWHPITLAFEGPETNEAADPNPFTDYRLIVDFTHGETRFSIRGYYAADGNAAETGATSGNVWHAKFTPDRPGAWRYEARLEQGDMVALSGLDATAERYPINNSSGSFFVEPSDQDGADFRRLGRLKVNDGYYWAQGAKEYWLKGGANSPENLLGYVDFDGTYRIKDNAREGEATAGTDLHRYEAHVADWKIGDPTWQDGKGKGLIGAINYLASTGMNAAYFLTFNIDGDGKDVWPFASPETFDRFDASKLDQWDIVFSHMQANGILLHMVLQETENELVMDGGDTGPQRQLYFNEMIARFGHHPGLVWNLGEENGPVHWRPEGQDTAQRLAMMAHLERFDPYDNPVLLHTHSEAADKDEIVTPLLGQRALDGLSFQVADRETVNTETQKWRRLAREAGQPWAITMDEIGMWHTGAKTDAADPTHDSLRRHALWGNLLGGGAGVEWYFGAHQPGNDLTSEDWRTRASLWSQTDIALHFFRQHLPFWEMSPCVNVEVYCLSKPGEIYVAYWQHGSAPTVTLPLLEGVYSVAWLDPLTGGDLSDKTTMNVLDAGQVPIAAPIQRDRDWVALIQKTEAE